MVLFVMSVTYLKGFFDMNTTVIKEQNLVEMNVNGVSEMVGQLFFFVKLTVVMGVMMLGLVSAYI
jgi:hypothetical protein